MPTSEGRITKPVSIDDVAICLGVGIFDTTTLCRSSKINPDAIFRPRYTSNPGLMLDEAGFQEIAGNISQRPKSHYLCPRYGVWVPTFALNNSMGSTFMSNLFSASADEWTIKGPEGNSYDRLDNFAGYYHFAKVQKPLNGQPAVVRRNAGGFVISAQLTTPAPDGATLSVSNLFGTAPGASVRWYFGLLVFRGLNSETWMPNDVMLVKGSNTAITNNAQPTTVTLSIEDTEADNTQTYYYRIIPFVSNRAGLTKDTLSDTSFYSLKINGDCPSWITKKTAGGGTTQDPNGADVQFFNWKDLSGGEYYPYPGRDDLKWPSYVLSPDLLIVYSEISEERYMKKNHSDLTYNNSLLNKYHRIEFHFTINAQGKPTTEYVYTWLRDDQPYDPDINVIPRDSQRDNIGNFENDLFFYIPQNQFWMQLQSQMGGSLITVSEMFGRFYFQDQYGEHFEDHFSDNILDSQENN